MRWTAHLAPEETEAMGKVPIITPAGIVDRRVYRICSLALTPKAAPPSNGSIHPLLPRRPVSLGSGEGYAGGAGSHAAAFGWRPRSGVFAGWRFTAPLRVAGSGLKKCPSDSTAMRCRVRAWRAAGDDRCSWQAPAPLMERDIYRPAPKLSAKSES